MWSQVWEHRQTAKAEDLTLQIIKLDVLNMIDAHDNYSTARPMGDKASVCLRSRS